MPCPHAVSVLVEGPSSRVRTESRDGACSSVSRTVCATAWLGSALGNRWVIGAAMALLASVVVWRSAGAPAPNANRRRLLRTRPTARDQPARRKEQ
jgi:hypothetical protein